MTVRSFFIKKIKAQGLKGHGKPLEKEVEDAGDQMETVEELAAALFIHR